MGKTRTDTLRVDNPTLEDLRWLVKETEGQPDDTAVSVNVQRGDRPYETTVNSISVVVTR